MKTTLKSIQEKYCKINYNEDNYAVGGGLSNWKFASNRHENAKNDYGKLTLGKAVQLFKKATGLETDQVKEIISYAVPNMEWHHAGKLPKSYGGGMKKTYFLNSNEICDLASNWNFHIESMNFSKSEEKRESEAKRILEQTKLEFLNLNAKKVVRVDSKPIFFYQTAQEMNGKYGWFDSTYKSYNMTEYYSGWEFSSQEKYQEFLNLK